MKIALKYLWSLAFIPFLVFLKGDLSVDTYMNINKIEPISISTKEVINNLKPIPKKLLSVKVKGISEHGQFSASGLAVYLYDENYSIVCKSQVINGRARFILNSDLDTSKTYSIVTPQTADELKLVHGSKTQELVVYEEHLKDSSIGIEE